MVRRRLNLSLSVLVTLGLLASACGDDENTGDQTQSFPNNPGPLTLSADQRGLPLELMRSYSANRDKYTAHAENAGAVFIYEQVYSEYSQATQGRTSDAELQNRIEELVDSYGTELDLYPNRYIVVDLQRRDRDWIVDWTGGVRDEPENRETNMVFGLDLRREDYWIEVQQQLQAVVVDASPDAIIIGTEMNLYHDQNPEDWASFVEFYWAAYDAIKTTDPSVRVSVGINWLYFMNHQVAPFVVSPEVLTDVVPFQRAYTAILDPLITRRNDAGEAIGSSDFVALSAIADPADLDNSPSNLVDWHFAGLRLLFPAGSKPIVWFQLGWPISNAGSAAPAEFFDRFLDLAGGTTVERVAWWGLTNLLEGDCTPLTGAEVGASQTVCFRGLYSVSGAETALSGSYFP